MNDYKVVELPGTPEQDIVGIATGSGSVLNWRAVATVGWKMRGIGLSAAGRYSPSYDDASYYTGLTGRRIASQTLLDLQASLDFDEFFGGRSGWAGGLKLTAGVSNALDEEPRFSEITEGQGFDPSQGDLRQRFGYLRLSASF